MLYSMHPFDRAVIDLMNEKLQLLEKQFEADVVFYYGMMHPNYEKLFRNEIEKLKDKIGEEEKPNTRLVIFLNTPGGDALAVEQMVNVTRHHYEEVEFVVPDYAFSAGTLFCMSGDKIHMDYSSSLGPIDPQVPVKGDYVPALGYLDKVNEMIGKPELSMAEIIMLQQQDLAMLRYYEQARDLTISLLKEWLVKYKFRNWNTHRTHDVGTPVTEEQKEERAREIAQDLGDNKKWHSHGRHIGIKALQALHLDIEDYSNENETRNLIREYNEIVTGYIAQKNFPVFLHSRTMV